MAKISRQISWPYIVEKNGLAERCHWKIVEMDLSMLSQYSMSLRYYNEAFYVAIFLENRLPSIVLDQRSPLDVLFLTKLDYHFLMLSFN